MSRVSSTLFMVAMLLFAPCARPHSLSASYLTVQDAAHGSSLSGRWEIALGDLQTLLDLDADANGAVTWGEVNANADRIRAIALPGLDLRRGGRTCAPRGTGFLLNERSDGSYLVVEFVAKCGVRQGQLQIAEGLLFERDRAHRVVLAVRDGERESFAVLTPDEPRWQASEAQVSALRTLAGFFREGVWHIWIGYDHIAFLVLLLLPVVLRRERNGWGAARDWRHVIWAAVRIVTAFTLAHSVTLSLAALGIVNPPEKLIEMAIAGSVAVACLLNLFPAAARFSVWVAFGFGLVHGFGFANVLAALGLESGSLAPPLAGFNLGVEAGQLAIVVSLVPLLYALRGSVAYRRRVVPATSIVVGLLAVAWLIERAG